MISFKEFLEESLDSQFEVSHHKELENELNAGLKGKVVPALTAVFHSDHMKENGHHIIRLAQKNNTIEYHFGSEGDFDSHKMDRKSIHHAMKIIMDDATEQSMKHKRQIVFQANNEKQFENYKSLADRLANKIGKSSKVGVGNRLDGGGEAKSVIVEHAWENAMTGFNKFRTKETK